MPTPAVIDNLHLIPSQAMEAEGPSANQSTPQPYLHNLAAFLRDANPSQTYVLTPLGRKPFPVTARATKGLDGRPQSSVSAQNWKNADSVVLYHLPANMGSAPNEPTTPPMALVSETLCLPPFAKFEALTHGEPNPESTVNPVADYVSKMIHQAALALFSKPPVCQTSPSIPCKLGPLCRLHPFHQHPPNSFSQGSFYDLQSATAVDVPESLSYDPDWTTLITSDRAGLRPLSTIFLAISQGNTDRSLGVDQILIHELVSSTKNRVPYFKAIGTKLGAFLAKLHDPNITQQLFKSRHSPWTTDFASREHRRLRYRREIQMMREHLQLWPKFFLHPTELDDICGALEADVAVQYFPDR